MRKPKGRGYATLLRLQLAVTLGCESRRKCSPQPGYAEKQGIQCAQVSSTYSHKSVQVLTK